MKRYLLLPIIVFFVSCTSSHKSKLSLKERPLYKVHKANSELVIDGKLDDTAWEKAEARTFDYYYLTDKEEEKQKTTFRMLWDEKYLYVHYDLNDKFINAAETKRDGAPYLDDCAELFLIPAPNGENIHYCFEINPNKAINDLVFVNDFYQGQNVAIRAFNPDFKLEVAINGTLNNNSDIDKGWSLEMAIPHETFNAVSNEFPIKKGSQWAFLALKQIRDDENIGRRVMSTLFPVENVKEKDVHQPSMFGLLEFVDQ
ncbi:carbohydrate-binding family 9-like protein [Wenyingzhuangia sp. 2_MG-2023]|uniref:carbohydrate-binding family 9-like protein n=1 Tax=Wenyingzhuangia sp. 2_MG-2023 TaxID=3062639 RepID=UPI0026E19640|nr:carbohydrate-binding family 9-like protein [Wenyingzhuangia sp. 2_MG-2023]MDO6739172.1 carbohydrate-binding family 9-like protein [Wenyingzhuangia sp. 2_MG-2023]